MKRNATLALISSLLLGAGSPFAMAQGTIVYHNPEDIRVFSDGATRFDHDVDLDGNGTVDFTFSAHSSFRLLPSHDNQIVGRPVGGFDLGNHVWPLVSNESIAPMLVGPDLFWTGPETYTSPAGSVSILYPYFHTRSTSGTAGPWQSGVNAYIGVRFEIDEALHYGWIKLLIPDTIPDNRRNGGIIEEWAYNSIPGQPILAGQVPEPGTVVLLTVGVALFGWRTWRRSLKV